ncbi:AraC family transcriptional regulator [Rhodopseudomonas palustris]|uniref:AraC family transcriptional regulator n=1 Tax=Rhodopseudomonas palustris TaxID=1076 RepID=UPI000CEC6E78|nr:AraC family transcriptional regulator [Rhodopseudomonas palustris]PPQ41807.1 AraC family transcriptional regulator [Rhodopseudomonas palustris]
MKIDLLGEPLDRFPMVRGSNPTDFESALKSVFGDASVEVSDRDGFRARLNFVRLSDIEMAYSWATVPSRLRLPPDDFVGLQLALSGSAITMVGNRRVVTNARQSCICPPGQGRDYQFDAEFEQLFLGVRLSALERTLAGLLGGKPNAPLEFEPVADNDYPHSENLRQLTLFFGGTLNATKVSLPSQYLAELEQATAVAFLHACKHNFSSYLGVAEKDAASRHVKLVEEYIEANWNESLTIEKLVELTGMSARTVFKAFQRTRGYSPMAFAKRVRMERVRQLLLEAGGDASVGAIAVQCGFPHLGHFAKDYRKTFGENPSDTLARGRRFRGVR